MEYGNGSVNHLVWQNVENRYHHEEDGLTLDNPNVNISVLGSEIEKGAVVLDVGCGEGKFGKLIREKECRVFGIEIDDVAIEAAKKTKNYEGIFNINIENSQSCEDYSRFVEMKICFDFIAIIDVLEHTINPTKVIQELGKFLKPDGKILISIPNVNNADIVLNLLRGKFNYMEAGILDNTHTKYFTKSSFIEWVDEMNHLCEIKFDCKYLGGIYGLTNYLEKIKLNMPRVFEYLQLNPEFNIIQNLFVLYKSSNELLYLPELMKENKPDLVQLLSDYLEQGMNESYMIEINGIKALANERFILQERALSAEKGWKECAESLKHISLEWESCEKKLRYTEAEWKKCENKLANTINEWKECDKKRLNAEAEWLSSDKKYQDLIIEYKKIDKSHQEALLGWKAAEKNYHEALNGWTNAENKYQEALDGWKKCDNQLHHLEEKCLEGKPANDIEEHI